MQIDPLLINGTLSCEGSHYLLLWRRFPLRFAEPLEALADLLHPTSSGLRLKGGVSQSHTGSAGEQGLVLQGAESAAPLPPLSSGPLGSG